MNSILSDARQGRLSELRQRVFFLVGAIVVYRVGAHIPVPGIDPRALSALFQQQGGSILDMFNMFSGGALKRLSVFALGIMPYISASIILQLMTIVVPQLEQLKKEGESGRKKINSYTRFATVGLACFQAIGVAFALQSQTANGLPIVAVGGVQFIVITAISLVCGTVFLMWLGEQVTERGLGNGISMIIFAGIVAGLPGAIGGALELVRTGQLSVFEIILLFGLSICVTALVVFVERGQRRIIINHPKRQQGRNVYSSQSTFLPLKLNMAGVIPPIFASSIILFPATLAGWLGQSKELAWLQDLAGVLTPGQPVYMAVYSIAIVFFCFFYTALVFNSKDTADNLKKSGAFIPGVRPGAQSANYIDGILTRLTLVGALYITAVCLLPELLILYWNVPFYFGGTSLLIIVVVVMDFISQVQTHLISHRYESLLKKKDHRKFS